MKILAKMVVREVKSTEFSDTVTMNAVYGGGNNAEDNTFSKATPSATLTMVIDNPEAQGILKPGRKFYVELTRVREDQAAAS